MRDVATEETLAGAAARYAGLGIPIFPCAPAGKRPLTRSGFQDATSSGQVVDRWWQRWPEANIGLPTGALGGVLVVDVDVRGVGSGYGAFQRARRAGIAEGWGWLVRTPSGGLHAYYPAGEAEQRSWQVASAHIDFRGDGGYVIAAPSRLEVNGRFTSYTVIAVTTHDPAPVDAGRLRRFLEPERRQLPPASSLPVRDASPASLAAWLAARTEGDRNASLFWAACRMVEGGHAYETTLSILGAAAHQAGLSEREVAKTLCSAYRIAARLGPTPPRDRAAGSPGEHEGHSCEGPTPLAGLPASGQERGLAR